MGHGAWMGITWGNMENGWMGPKHSSQNITYFNGICFKGSSCISIETRIGLPSETWHVSVGGRFWGSCFEAHVLWCVIFNWQKQASSFHRNSTCFHVGLLQAPTAHGWKPTLGCLEASNAFTTCCWNNVKDHGL
jgi:hypothetical protein